MEKSWKGFNVEQGVIQGCSLSPIYIQMYIYINVYYTHFEVQRMSLLSIQLSSGNKISVLLFADD